MLIHLLRPAKFLREVPVKSQNLLEDYLDDDYFGNFDNTESIQTKKYYSVSPLDLTYQKEPNSAC